MTRRDFINNTAKAAITLPFVSRPDFMRAVRMGIVVHSYGMRWHSKIQSEKYPGFENAIDLLEHCQEIGAGGIQVQVSNWSSDFSMNVRDLREKLGMFLEGSISLPKGKEDVNRFERDIAAAREAGATIVRTVCLSGRRYENFKSIADFRQFEKDSIASLQAAEGVVRKYKVRLAIENHKDWRARELADILATLSSEWVGVNLDFGNNVALIEDPMDVVEALAPYTFTTHVKDMGVKKYEDGFLLSEVPLGEGFLDLEKMFEVCRKHRSDVNFNLEMITRDPLKIPCLTDNFWETFRGVEAQELANTLRVVKQNSFPGELPSLSHLGDEQRLAAEEQNIIKSLAYSRANLGMS